MSHDIQILVNGSRCKQYNHNGKVFIEAKRGSEYSIEIKNHSFERILAVCSVDGLDILNGKPAKEDGPGYVINGYNNGKFDGFRVSDEKVAKFVFDCKGESYAASKGDNSEKNVGVIGVRLFEELQHLPPPPEKIYIHHDYPPIKPIRPWGPWTPYEPMWCGDTYTTCGHGMTRSCNNSLGDRETYSCNNIPTKGEASSKSSLGNQIKLASVNTTNIAKSIQNNTKILRGFDMGTKWGEAKESKVIEVEFERGILALSKNIYYASRQSLIEMGVPIGNEKQVSFPEPFRDSKYATPPKNWKG
jgi:hypothetical protein